MRHRHRTLSEHLLRSLALAGVIYAAAAAYVVPVSLLAEQPPELRLSPPAEPGTSSPPPSHPHWRTRYARRFPGCQDIASWAHARVPVTVIVVDRTQRPRRLPFDDAFAEATTSGPGEVWIVGACG
jgi:hypothetical protein